MIDNETLNPLAVLEEFRSSNNPDVKKLLTAIKENKYNTKEDDGFYDIYENMLIEDYKKDGFTEKQSILYSFYFGLAKETVDALVPWEIHGSIGGDGFSKYDLAYDLAGILCAWGVDKIWKPKENSKWERGFNHTGFSISYRLY